MSNQLPEIFEAMFKAAVDRAQPSLCVPPHLPDAPDGRLIILACGKAGALMAKAAEDHYLGSDTNGQPRIDPDRLSGLCVTRHGYGVPLRQIDLVEAGHPLPDESGYHATRSIMEMAGQIGPDDLALVLISGGGSANWSAPAAGLSFPDLVHLTRQLLASGAPISDMNIIRKHVSAIKGGHLAALLYPARSVSLLISDVPGDDPAYIASGPTVPDPSTADDALRLIKEHKIDVTADVMRVLSGPQGETPKPGDEVFDTGKVQVIARPADSLDAAASIAKAQGYQVHMLGDRVEGEARDVARDHAERAIAAAEKGEKCVFLSGGELTVTIKGTGRGGPNQEYALGLAVQLFSASGISAFAADTDGTDGGAGASDDPAGAWIDPDVAALAAAKGLNPAAFLDNNDSRGFFDAIGRLYVPGPTGTNVNDLRCIIVDKSAQANH